MPLQIKNHRTRKWSRDVYSGGASVLEISRQDVSAGSGDIAGQPVNWAAGGFSSLCCCKLRIGSLCRECTHYQAECCRQKYCIDWQIASPTGNLVATYRGIRIVIKLGENRNPLEIGWYINGQVEESVPLSYDLEWAKQLAIDVIDERIPEDDVWQEAERKDREPDLG
jgi:hypothetical protein